MLVQALAEKREKRNPPHGAEGGAVDILKRERMLCRRSKQVFQIANAKSKLIHTMNTPYSSINQVIQGCR